MRLIKNKSLHILLFFSAFLAGTLLISCGTTQTAAEKEQKMLRIKEKIDSHTFTFNAETAYPMRFRPVHLTSSYDLKVSKDTLQVFLPYFGRAYVAPLDPTEGGIKFTSTKFEYSIAEGKRSGNWKVTIKTFAAGRSWLLFLDIWENGTARLMVNDAYRQSISFDGYIVDGDK